MSRIVWTFGWVGVLVWSLLCAAAYGLLDVIGRLSMRNADAFSADPDTVEGLWHVFSVLHSLSTGAVLVAWALVSLLILAVPWAVDRMIGPPASRDPRRPGLRRPMPSGRGDVIDLAPDQYSVGPPAGRANGPAPRADRG